MVFQERTYSVLLVTASDGFVSSVMPLLPVTDYWPVTTVRSVGEARRRIVETDFDIVLINAPLPDDFGMRPAPRPMNIISPQAWPRRNTALKASDTLASG